MKLILIALLLHPSFTYSQAVVFKEIKMRPRSRFFNTNDSTIIYPIIVTKNSIVNKLINHEIREDVIGPAEGSKNLRRDLNNLINDGVINLFYEVTYKKHGLLSLNIFTEACGAYCSSDYTYFNFDLRTGKRLKTTDLIYDDKLDSLKKNIFSDKIAFLEKYKTEESKLLMEKKIDSATYQWAIEQVDSNCMNELHVENFILSEHYIEVVDECPFPHAIRSREPAYHLKYLYRSIQAFLKPEFLKLLMK